MENAGGIEYTIDVNTAGVIKQIDSTTDANNRLGKSFNGIDTSAKKTNTAIAGVGRSAGQAGIQLQQFVGQIQGGQSAMLALSQQSADLGFVLGAPLLGAVVGVSASLAGMFLPSLFDSTDAAKTLEKALEELDKVVTASGSGVNVLSNEYAKLAKQNQALAEATAVSQLKNIQNALDAITDTITETTEGFEGFFGEIEKADFQELSDYINQTGNSIENLNDTFYAQDGLIFAQKTVKELQEQLGLSAEEALKLGLAIGDVSQGGGVESIEKLGDELTKLAKNKGPEASQALVDLQLKMTKLADDSTTLAEKQSILQKVMDGVTVESEDQSDATQDLTSKYAALTKALKAQADQLGMSRSETLEYNKALALSQAEIDGQSQATKDSIAESYNRQIAFARETEATKAQADADKKAAKAKKDSIKADQEAFDAMNALLEADKKRKAEQANTVSRFGGASYASGIGIDTEGRLQQLQAVHDAELISEEEFQAQKLAIMTDYNAQIMALSEERFRQESEGNAFLMDSLDALGSTATNVFSGMLSGTMTAKEAMAAFANAILNQAIGALVQMGIQQVKNQIIGQSAAAANVAVAATSGAAIAAAYAPAAAMASLASFGANAAPAQAGITSTSLLAKTMAVTGRATGGPVSASSMYQMGENNQPEVLQTGSGMFAVPGDSGRVFNRNQLDKIDGGQGGGFSITINNQPGVISTVISQDEKSAIIENAVNMAEQNYVSQMNSKDGKMFNATAKNYGSGKTGGRPQ